MFVGVRRQATGRRGLNMDGTAGPMLQETPLEHLRKLTDRLTEQVRELKAKLKLSDIVVPETALVGRAIYDLGDGHIVKAFTVWHTAEVQVIHCSTLAGGHLPKHQHDDAMEWLVLFAGSMNVQLGNAPMRLLVAPAVIEFPVGCPHTWDILTDVHYLGITIPPAEGYPP